MKRIRLIKAYRSIGKKSIDAEYSALAEEIESSHKVLNLSW